MGHDADRQAAPPLRRRGAGVVPAMGKVYDRMFMIGQMIEKSNVPWKATALKKRSPPAINPPKHTTLHRIPHPMAANWVLREDHMSAAFPREFPDRGHKDT